MKSPVSVNHDNIRLLNETIDLLASLTTEIYTHKSLLFNADTPGAHVRHVVEHYELFLAGLTTGHINYDLRRRNLKLSSDPKAAICRIKELAGQIDILSDEELRRLIDIKMDTGDVCQTVETSVGRELQFLWSHHVHHNAMIRMIIESFGENVAKDFGVAASTKKFQDDKDKCAR